MKAQKVMQRPQSYVIGCDQAVSFERKLYSEQVLKNILKSDLEKCQVKLTNLYRTSWFTKT